MASAIRVCEAVSKALGACSRSMCQQVPRREGSGVFLLFVDGFGVRGSGLLGLEGKEGLG
eukprot:2459263-Rhodomonas_salina.1